MEEASSVPRGQGACHPRGLSRPDGDRQGHITGAGRKWTEESQTLSPPATPCLFAHRLPGCPLAAPTRAHQEGQAPWTAAGRARGGAGAGGGGGVLSDHCVSAPVSVSLHPFHSCNHHRARRAGYYSGAVKNVDVKWQ